MRVSEVIRRRCRAAGLIVKVLTIHDFAGCSLHSLGLAVSTFMLSTPLIELLPS